MKDGLMGKGGFNAVTDRGVPVLVIVPNSVASMLAVKEARAVKSDDCLDVQQQKNRRIWWIFF